MTMRHEIPKVTWEAIQEGVKLRNTSPITPRVMEEARIFEGLKMTYRMFYHMLRSAGELPDISCDSWFKATYEIHGMPSGGDISSLDKLFSVLEKEEFNERMGEGIDRYFHDVFLPRIKKENPLYLAAISGAVDGPKMNDTDRYSIVSMAMVVYRAFELELNSRERESYRQD